MKQIKSSVFSMLIKSDFGSFGKGSIIRPPFTSYDPGDTYIGTNCLIAEGCWIQGFSQCGNKKFNPLLSIGNGTYIGRNGHIMACLEMNIGCDVVIADGVYITDNLHGFEDIQTPIMKQELKTPGPVTIEDQVWLGERVCVLPNVTIGRHSIIGSGSVVTKSIPPYSVAVGIPAVVIRRYNEKNKKWERAE